jgi:hypothetical protein
MVLWSEACIDHRAGQKENVAECGDLPQSRRDVYD